VEKKGKKERLASKKKNNQKRNLQNQFKAQG
jgi:hypothetical protein